MSTTCGRPQGWSESGSCEFMWTGEGVKHPIFLWTS